MTGSTVLLVLVVVLVAMAFGIGRWWGGRRARPVERALKLSEARGTLIDARTHLLEARLAIYSVNFGDASRHLEDARSVLLRVQTAWKSHATTPDLAALHTALGAIDDAQRLVGHLDQNANTRVADAAKIVTQFLAASVQQGGAR